MSMNEHKVHKENVAGMLLANSASVMLSVDTNVIVVTQCKQTVDYWK